MNLQNILISEMKFKLISQGFEVKSAVVTVSDMIFTFFVFLEVMHEKTLNTPFLRDRSTFLASSHQIKCR